MEDVHFEEYSIARKKQEELQKSKSSNDESGRVLAQLFGQNNSLRLMDGVSKKVQIVLSSGKQAPSKMVDMFVEENRINKHDMSPYVLSKITQMTEEVCRDSKVKGSQRLQGTQSSVNISQLGQSMISNGGGAMDISVISTHPNAPGIRFPPRHSSYHDTSVTSASKLQLLDDSYLLDKCNAVINCEARVDRIMKRYRVYKEETKQINDRVRRTCDARRDFLLQENLKPPKLPQELRQENDDVLEIIARKDDYEEKKKARVLEAMKDKYSKVWKNVHVPKLTEKYTQIFRRQQLQHQQIDEEDEQESSMISTSNQNNNNYNGGSTNNFRHSNGSSSNNNIPSLQMLKTTQ